jgi:hypothetical protein
MFKKIDLGHQYGKLVIWKNTDAGMKQMRKNKYL